MDRQSSQLVPKPTVSPAKNSLVYFISIVYIDHLGWGSHREEAKRGPPSGHRITRNGAAMVSWLLPYAPVCAHRVVPHRGVVGDRGNLSGSAADACLGYIPQALYGSPSAPPITAQRVTRFDHYRARNYLPPQKLRREIQ